MLRQLLFIVAAALTAVAAAQRYVGGDISLLPLYEAAGAEYKTPDGRPVADLLAYCRAEGMNAMRVRLFVDPAAYTGPDRDPNACQDLDMIIPLCRRIKDAGLALMLDFMYSDTWADPGKQWTPARWASADDGALCDSLAAYTRSCLTALTGAGAVPDFIQVGNEISYGMLWGPYGTPPSELKKTFLGSDANWARLGSLLKSAIGACRSTCPDAKIIIQTERTADIPVQRNFYSRMAMMGIDYDIIGLSYYPYFHGGLAGLSAALTELETDFPAKEIMIVETGFPYKWAVPGSTEPLEHPVSEEGQASFARDLVAILESHPRVDGLFWWWMEYNAYGTSLSGWYNAPLFDSTTGRATEALSIICSFASGSGIAGAATDRQDDCRRRFDLSGRPVAEPSSYRGIMIGEGVKTLIRR